MSHLRDAGELLAPAVAATLAELDLADCDAAVAKLAERYAAEIDATLGGAQLHAWAMRWIAPLLLDCLRDLGATPMARSRLKEGSGPDAREDPLTALRKARRA